MFSKLMLIPLTIALGYATFGCTQKKEETKVEAAAPKADNSATTSDAALKESMKADAEVEAESLKVDELPVAKEWAAIWKSKDTFLALKDFQQKHGLFLETGEKIGEASVLTAEGPCGNEYVSLVKDAKKLSETVLEIDSSGKVLREWHTGSSKIIAINKIAVYREVQFYERVSNYGAFASNSDMRTHKFILAITPEGSVDLVSENAKIAKWETTEVKCPTDLKAKSDYKYCVKDKKSERLFVLEGPCT